MKRRAFVASVASGALTRPFIARADATRTLRFIPNSDLAILDPVWSTAYVTRNHGYLVFDTLYGQTGPESGFKARPQMLAGHVVEDDGRTWRLTLRDGLRFHDGQPVLARDCVASIKRWAARDGFGQSLFEQTDELSADDDRTIRFRLKQPFRLLPDALGKAGSNMCAMMPERLAATDPFKPVTEMVGSGPFRFLAAERIPGARVAYERFEAYVPRDGAEAPDWTAGPKIAHFDRIEWHTIPDPATAAAALQSAEVDGWERPTGDLLPLLARDRKLKLELVYETGGCMLLRFNHLFKPFDNPAVRRALMPLVDQTETMIAVMGDNPSLRRVPCGFFPPDSPMASDAGMAALTDRTPDVKRVRADLQAAGYRGETVVVLLPTDYPVMKAATEVVIDMLTRAGMAIDAQAVDWGTLLQRRASRKPPEQGGWNAICVNISGDEMHTPATSQLLRGTGNQAWPGWPTSPRLETLRNQWLLAPDTAAQRQIAAAIQLQAFEEVPFVPLGFFYNPCAYRADLAGILRGFPTFWNIRRV